MCRSSLCRVMYLLGNAQAMLSKINMGPIRPMRAPDGPCLSKINSWYKAAKIQSYQLMAEDGVTVILITLHVNCRHVQSVQTSNYEFIRDGNKINPVCEPVNYT